jgi:hypothetical protein
MLHVHAFLEFCKTGNSALEGHDLAVCDEGVDTLLMQRRDYLRILIIELLPVARKEAQAMTIAESKAPFAIPLRFK